jgi:XTP/dITP diphosphohydrolase
MKKTLLVASANPGKVREIKAILHMLDLSIISAKEAGVILDVAETGQTYAENAWLKARAYQEASGLIVLADDSGLEVDALDGAPGIYSARYAAIPNATDADRRHHLLEQLKGKPQPWPAHFHCTAILAGPSGKLAETEGRCDGNIIPEERGEGGFGYDPIFYIPEEKGTMAELPEERKNQISHRARALQGLIPALNTLFDL